MKWLWWGAAGFAMWVVLRPKQQAVPGVDYTATFKAECEELGGTFQSNAEYGGKPVCGVVVDRTRFLPQGMFALMREPGEMFKVSYEHYMAKLPARSSLVNILNDLAAKGVLAA